MHHHIVCAALRIKPKVLCMLGKHSASYTAALASTGNALKEKYKVVNSAGGMPVRQITKVALT